MWDSLEGPLYFWSRFYIVILEMTFFLSGHILFFHILFGLLFPLFYLDFYFFFRLLFLFWTFIFLFAQIAIWSWISSKFFLSLYQFQGGWLTRLVRLKSLTRLDTAGKAGEEKKTKHCISILKRFHVEWNVSKCTSQKK